MVKKTTNASRADQIRELIDYYTSKTDVALLMHEVITMHVDCEKIMGDLIRNRCANAKDILKDHRTYTFAVKNTILLNAVIIPKALFLNLKTLNDARNLCAHEHPASCSTRVRQKLLKMTDAPFRSNERNDLSALLSPTYRNISRQDATLLQNAKMLTLGWILMEFLQQRGSSRPME